MTLFSLRPLFFVCAVLSAACVLCVNGLDGMDSRAVGTFSIANDNRKEITISSYGLGPGGFFNVTILNFKVRSLLLPLVPACLLTLFVVCFCVGYDIS